MLQNISFDSQFLFLVFTYVSALMDLGVCFDFRRCHGRSKKMIKEDDDALCLVGGGF